MAHAYGFRVDDRHANRGLQFPGCDDIGVDFSAQWNDRLRALLDELAAGGDRALDDDVMVI